MGMKRLLAMALVAALGLSDQSMASGKLSEGLSGVTLLPGDTRIFKLEKGHPIFVREANENEEPDVGELKARFFRNENGMFLVIENHTHQFLNYHADLRRKLASSEESTSVCTILNEGRLAFEHWPYDIASIRIDDFAPDPKEQVICR